MWDLVLWVCMAWTASNIGCTHWLMVRYNIWRKDSAIIGRYVTGVVCFGLPFLVWCISHADRDAMTTFCAFCALVAAAGLATIGAYVFDMQKDYNARGDDLKRLGLHDGT